MEQTAFELTLREHDVVKLVTRGHIAKTAASALGLSEPTVEHYLKTARDRNECTTTTQLVGQYVKAQLTGNLVLLPLRHKGARLKRRAQDMT